MPTQNTIISYIVQNDVWISICCSCGCTGTLVTVEKNLHLSTECNSHNKTNTPVVVSRCRLTSAQVQCKTSKECHLCPPTSVLCPGQLCQSFEWDQSLTLDRPGWILLSNWVWVQYQVTVLVSWHKPLLANSRGLWNSQSLHWMLDKDCMNKSNH